MRMEARRKSRHNRYNSMKKISFNRDWKFQNDIHKSEEITVSLPHDAMQTEKRLEGMKNGAAAGFFPGGRYVYRKTLYGEEAFRDQAIYLEFEGIYMRSTVYLNDEKVGGWIYGYTGFYVDLTGKLKIGQDNEIRVVADNSRTPNSRWYTGSGIYRNVCLHVGEKRHIAPDGICVTTESTDPAVIRVRTEIENADRTTGGTNTDTGREQVDDAAYTDQERGQRTGQPKIHVEVYERMPVTAENAAERRCSEKLAASGEGCDCRIEVPGAKMWSAETPRLYRIRVCLMDGERVADEQSVITGIRSLAWSAENGLQVNGQEVKLRGGCIHHDNGILGACAPDKVEYRKAKILKEAGFNAVRSAHNPISRSFLAACDELGLYVMDEAFDQWRMQKIDYDYGLYFDREWKKDLGAMIRKDRNHPSVIMYSIGNEIADTGSKDGGAISRKLSEFCHRMDPTRPTTNGINPVVSNMGGALNNGKTTPEDVVDPYEEKADAQATASLLANMIATAAPFISRWMGKPKKVEKLLKPCFDAIDIVGYNYAEQCYEPHHEWDPERIMVGTETYPQSVAHRWPFIASHSYVVGDFMWTAMDYLGEAGIGVSIYGTKKGGFNRPYPCISGGCGAIDLIGHVETEGYWAAIAWGQYKKPYIAVRPVNHTGEDHFFGMWRGTDAVSSWSWKNMEGRRAQIEVYSPGEEVELYQDGKSLGRKPLTECRALYDTVYGRGELRAVCYDAHGARLAEETLRSAGEKTYLTVTPEETCLLADGEDMTFLSVELTDEDGIIKFLEDRKVMISVTGAGVLTAVGSGNPVTTEPFTGNSYTTWFGRMGCYVRSSGEPGEAKVTVAAEDLEPVEILLTFV